MDLFLINKQVHFNVGLSELKNMTPEEAYLFERRVAEAVKQLENGI